MQIHKRTELKRRSVNIEDQRRAEMSHTPVGWVPANQRGDHVDPLARQEEKARQWREERKR